LKLTEYLDEKRLSVNCCIEIFKYRRDKLNRRITWPLERKIEEHFLPGRPSALKTYIDFMGKRQESYYYVEARLDGLESRIIDLGVKIFENYVSRPDSLRFRSARLSEVTQLSTSPYTLQDAAPQGEMIVTKMTEKYDDNEENINEESKNNQANAHMACAKRTFYVSDNRIRTIKHFGKSKITRERNLIFKDRSLVQNNIGSNSNGFEDANIDTEEDNLHLAQMAEKECFTSLRHNHMEYLKLLQTRLSEEKDVKLDFPTYYYDTKEDTEFRQKLFKNRTKAVVQQDADPGVPSAAGLEEEVFVKVDYLTPFLQLVKDENNLSRDEARHVRDMCLKAAKERLLERANIIQSRLNEENLALSKLQANYTRSQQASEAGEEEYHKTCEASMFRIRILQDRLKEHESAAYRKIEELDEKLANDSRLILSLRS